MRDIATLTVDELLAFAIDTENNWLPRRMHVQELARRAKDVQDTRLLDLHAIIAAENDEARNRRDAGIDAPYWSGIVDARNRVLGQICRMVSAGSTAEAAKAAM